jgi:hypothetical protein
VLRERAAGAGSAGTTLDQKAFNDLRERYDTAARSAIIHNRLRDWDTGNHLGYALGSWLRD